jgi:hypothetical protein
MSLTRYERVISDRTLYPVTVHSSVRLYVHINASVCYRQDRDDDRVLPKCTLSPTIRALSKHLRLPLSTSFNTTKTNAPTTEH